MAVLIYITIKRGDYLISGWLWALILVEDGVIFMMRQDYMSCLSSSIIYRGTIGGRYPLFSITILLLIILRQIDLWLSRTIERRSVLNLVPLLLLIIFLGNVVIHYEQVPFIDMHFGQYVDIYVPHGNDTCNIPLNTPGWSMKIPCNANGTKLYT